MALVNRWFKNKYLTFALTISTVGCRLAHPFTNVMTPYVYSLFLSNNKLFLHKFFKNIFIKNLFNKIINKFVI